MGEGWVELSVPTHSEAAIWRSGDGQGGIPTELQLLRLDLYDFHHGLTAIEKPLPASSTDLPLLGSPLEVASPAEGDSNVVVDYNSLTGNVGQAKAARLSFLRETFRNRVSQQGPDSERWCRTCYHMGHDDPSDQVACPVARIRTYLDQSFVAPYIVGEAMGITHIDLFFIDVPIILEGYFWAVDMVRAGDGHIFGITIPEVRRLEGLVEKCEGLKKLGLILPQEGFEGMDQPFLGVSYLSYPVFATDDRSPTTGPVSRSPSRMGSSSRSWRTLRRAC